MKGLARRLATQTLSQILTFGLCASSTESAMQHLAQRHQPAVRTNAFPHHDPAEERQLRDALLRIQADEKNACACHRSIRERAEGQTELAKARKRMPEPQKASYKPSELIDKICAPKQWQRVEQVPAMTDFLRFCF